MLKPALASGHIRVIGATTEYEYGRYIRADAALERRFQPVRVSEIGREQTLEVLCARKRLKREQLQAAEREAIDQILQLERAEGNAPTRPRSA